MASQCRKIEHQRLTTDAENTGGKQPRECLAGLRTLLLRCYRRFKLPLVFEPNAMRKEEGRPKPPENASNFVRLLGENQSKLSALNPEISS